MVVNVVIMNVVVHMPVVVNRAKGRHLATAAAETPLPDRPPALVIITRGLGALQEAGDGWWTRAAGCGGGVA